MRIAVGACAEAGDCKTKAAQTHTTSGMKRIISSRLGTKGGARPRGSKRAHYRSNQHPEKGRLNVRFGSKAGMEACPRNVRSWFIGCADTVVRGPGDDLLFRYGEAQYLCKRTCHDSQD